MLVLVHAEKLKKIEQFFLLLQIYNELLRWKVNTLMWLVWVYYITIDSQMKATLCTKHLCTKVALIPIHTVELEISFLVEW